MNVKRAKVENKLLDVIPVDSYRKDLYGNNNTAVEVEYNGDHYILPVRSSSDDRPGLYDIGAISFLKYPEDCSDADIKKEDYLYDHVPVYDFSSATGINDVLNTQAQIRGMEADLLTDIDSVYRCVRHSDDSPEMTALKDAIDMKSCDLNKYSQRYGENYLNDKRILKGKDITLKKLVAHAQNLDMEVELIIRDKSDDVPNPMGSEVKTILTGRTNDE